MTQEPSETDGHRSADDPAAAASSKSGVPLDLPPSEPPNGAPASAGRERDPADARPHFTTETGTDKTDSTQVGSDS
jgi:hypothetical protein